MIFFPCCLLNNNNKKKSYSKSQFRFENESFLNLPDNHKRVSLTTSLSIENAEIEAAPYAVVSADVVVPSADSVTKGAAIIINSDEYNFASVSMSFFLFFHYFYFFLMCLVYTITHISKFF